MPTDDTPFLARWARRKAAARSGIALPEPPAAPAPEPLPGPVPLAGSAPTGLAGRAPTLARGLPAALSEPPAQDAEAATDAGPTQASRAASSTEPPEPAPTLDNVALLTRESDFTRFVARGVQPEVRNAALKKLFTDPHFNVMDGLDTYIDDYGRPDPLPARWLRQMVQSQVLGLFEDDPATQEAAASPPASSAPAPAPAPAPTADFPPSEAEPHAHPDLQLQPHDDAGRAGAAPGADPDAGRPD